MTSPARKPKPPRLLTAQTLPYFRERLLAIQSTDQPRWGKLVPAGLMAHLSVAVEGSHRDLGAPDPTNWFQRNVLRWLVFEAAPRWPRGKIKVPDAITPPPKGSLDEERAALLRHLEVFTSELAKAPDRPGGVHPFFGRQSLRGWARFHARHFEHHFQQYGV